MLALSEEEFCAASDYEAMIDKLQQTFRSEAVAPPRGHYTIPVSPGAHADATLLLMPAWLAGAYLGVKVATVFPAGAATGQPSVNAQYMLMRATDGALLATMPGRELTARRTGAASALAARHLARKDARRHLIVGAGELSPHLARAHRAAAPHLERVTIWARDPQKALARVRALQDEGVPATVAKGSLESSVREADIISAATLSRAPLIFGAWLSPGAHLDLVGGFTPHMREADDDAIARARIVCDNRDALVQSGDLADPIAHGLVDPATIDDLGQLCRGERPGRTDESAVTLYKSVGSAIEDLAAAVLAYERQKNVLNASTTV